MTDTRCPDRWLTDRRIQRLSLPGYRLFFNALMYSVGNRTDGVIEPDDLSMIPGYAPGLEGEMITAGLWKTTAQGWLLVEFSDTQTSKAEHDALSKARASNRRRVARFRARKAEEKARNVTSNGTVTATSNGTETRTTQDRSSLQNSRPKEPFLSLNGSSVVSQSDFSKAESLPESGTALGRPVDSMGRPSMSLTVLAGGVERRPEPPPPDRHLPPEAAQLVRAVFSGQPRPWLEKLVAQVGQGLNDGADYAASSETLDRMKARLAAGEDIYPGSYPHLLAQVMSAKTITPEQRRNGTPPTRKETKLARIDALREHPRRNPTTRKELT